MGPVTVFVDYDNTLHDSDSKFIAGFDGPARALGIDGRKLWRLYLFDVHRAVVHEFYPERHDDKEFHCRLIFEKLGKPYDAELAAWITKAFDRAMEECWKNPSFFEDTFVFLDEILGKYKVCLATSENALEKAASVERFGGKKYFDCVLGDHNVGIRKTKKDYYLRALELSASKPEESVMIGDSVSHDILPASEVGMKTIWVNRKDEAPPKNLRSTHEVKSLIDVLKYI